MIPPAEQLSETVGCRELVRCNIAGVTCVAWSTEGSMIGQADPSERPTTHGLCNGTCRLSVRARMWPSSNANSPQHRKITILRHENDLYNVRKHRHNNIAIHTGMPKTTFNLQQQQQRTQPYDDNNTISLSAMHVLMGTQAHTHIYTHTRTHAWF